MPSPFPEMDPYIESQGGWRGFLMDFIVRCKWQLNEHLPSQYAAIAGERVEVLEPLPPNIEMLDVPKQVYVEIIHLPGQEIVTDIEVLSPSNKRPGSRDRAAYLSRRGNLLDHSVNVVEFDLLLGGERIPALAPPPSGNYFASITQRAHPDRSDMCGWSVRDPLPTVLVPLRHEDGAVPLDLAAAFQQTYEGGRYDRILRHAEPLALLNEFDRAWVADKVADRHKVSR